MDPTTCAATVTQWWPLIIYAALVAGCGIGLIMAAILGANGRDKGHEG